MADYDDPLTVVAHDHHHGRPTSTRCSASRPDATTAQIKSAYRKLAKQYHPDVNDSPTRLRGSGRSPKPTTP